MSDKSSNVRLVEEPAEPAQSQIDASVIGGVEVVLEARLGSATMSVTQLMELKAGDCVTLDAALNSDVELRLNGVTIARGELVAVGDSFGVRIAALVSK